MGTFNILHSSINEMTEMFKKLYRDTGLRFYMWYRKNFNMFIQKLNRSEVDVRFYVLVYFLFQLYETRAEFHLKKSARATFEVEN